ncbi:MAG TPA: ankyrin repeat domain-containing protein [Elusimicrobiota bacterium]|nr:ankyrin repeat domain-containing protein [Elusimicrobiota bacterium]
MNGIPRAAAAASLLLVMVGCEAPLSKAIRRGDPGAIAARLDAGDDINGSLGASSRTPLQIAAAEGRLDAAKLLLDRGADVNVRRKGTSALSQAVMAGDVEMTKLLLSRGAEVGRRELLWANGPHKAEISALLRDAAARQAAAEREAAAKAAGPSLSSAPASAVDEPSYKAGERPDDVALVVSVAKTMDGTESRFAAEDAAAVRRHLIALGWPSRNIVLLSDRAAGRAGLSRYLERWLPNNVVENSRLVFYFAGPGTSDAVGRAYLLPWDGDPSQPEATCYPLTRLYGMLNDLKVRSAVAVIDAGFSGEGPRSLKGAGAKVPAPKIDLGAAAVGSAVVLTAAGDAKPAGLEENEHHGKLTYLLLKGLNGAALDEHGAVTLKDLYRYVRTQAPEQNPQALTGGLGEGDLRLR